MNLPRLKKKLPSIQNQHPQILEEIKQIKLELQKYKSIFELSPEAVILLDTKGVMVEANQRLYKWLGYSESELIGLTVDKLPYLTVENKIIAKQNFNKRLGGQSIPPYEFTFLAKDGKEETGLITAGVINDALGKPVYDLIMIVNTTLSSKLKKSISFSEEKFRSLFSSSLEGLVFTDLNGKIFDANPAYIKLTGYSLDELITMTTYDITPQKWRALERKVVEEQLLAKGYCDEYEKEYIRKDGTIIKVLLRKWVSKNDSGQPIGFWASFRDITVSKKLEEENKKIAAEQAEKSEELQRFNELMVGRELKMIELKENNAKLAQEISELKALLKTVKT